MDAVVVGGGLLGVATCYWLARAGIEVVLLEKTALAWGATGRNGGFVRAGPAGSYLETITRLGRDTACATMDVTLESQALLRQVVQEETLACEYREPGSLRLALIEAQAEQYRREIDVLRADNYAAEWLSRCAANSARSICSMGNWPAAAPSRTRIFGAILLMR